MAKGNETTSDQTSSMSEDGFEKPQAMAWKPGKPGDAIKGIFTGNVKEFEGQYGKSQIYELVGIEGSWNTLDADGNLTGIVGNVVAGALYGVFSRKTIEDDIKRAKPGQKIIVKYVELRKPKTGGKPYKVVECLLGGMDEKWLAEQGNSQTVAPADIPFGND